MTVTRRKTPRLPYHPHWFVIEQRRNCCMTLRVFPIVTVLATCLIVPANGQENGKRSTLRSACQDDYRRLCAGVTPGGGRIKQCMVENSAKLSTQCKAALDAGAKLN
jgi:hypothetical protein